MLRLPFLLTALAVLPGPRYLVVPGRSVGTIQLGTDPTTALAGLGPASHTEAALGESWQRWLGKAATPGTAPTQLDVFWSRPPGAAPGSTARTVQLVRVTSPAFQLASGIHVGTPVSDLYRAFPKMDKVYSLQLGGEEPRSVIDAPEQGIAFELSRPARGKGAACVAIVVHPPGTVLSTHYLGLKPYLEALARGH